jgi:hypothetical protein
MASDVASGTFSGSIYDSGGANYDAFRASARAMVEAGKPTVMTYQTEGAGGGHAVFRIGYALEEWNWQFTITWSDGRVTRLTEYEFYEWDLVLDPEGDGTVSCVLAREYKRDASGNTVDRTYPGMSSVSTFAY